MRAIHLKHALRVELQKKCEVNLRSENVAMCYLQFGALRYDSCMKVICDGNISCMQAATGSKTCRLIMNGVNATPSY